jgi:uracil-DNA glycosylase
MLCREQKIMMEKKWLEVLKEEFEKPYMLDLQSFLSKEMAIKKEVFPPPNLIFNAMCQTSYDDVRVVVVGQDPYHGEGQAHGLAFSVQKGVAVPPSLQNMYKEMHSDVGTTIPTTGCLVPLAKQGVLLLNATLTVEKASPKSHYGRGWEVFTDRVLEVLSNEKNNVVFLLWGKSAQEKCLRVLDNSNNKNHLILTAAHPSPFSAYNGFFGCRHFSKTNKFLRQNGKEEINWQI